MAARADGSAAPEEGGTHHPLAASHGGAAGDNFPAPIAATLDRLELRGVADFLLDVCRPFGWLGAQLVLVAQPTLSLFGADRHSARLAAWLEQLDKEKSRET